MKKILAKFLTLSAVTLTCFLVASFAVSAEEKLNIDAKSAVLMEAYSGTVLHSENEHESLPPASVTKIMTILLTYDALLEGKIKPDEVVSISEHAAGMGGSQVFLEPNEEQTVDTLLRCVIIASANDAAVALAEKISGSEEAFVQDMNRRAKELGMNNTTFKNACGLDADGHTTSAYDIALMTRELITKYPQVFEHTKTWQDTITHVTRRGSEEFGLTNTNKLIRMYKSATGLKTGSTGKALFCLSATAERDGMELISVIMGAANSKIRFGEAVRLLDYGYANYEIKRGDSEGTKKGDVVVFKGHSETVEAVVKDEVKALAEKGEANELSSEVKLYEYVDAPVEKGMKIGEIVYSLGGAEAGASDLIAAESVPKLNFSKTLKKLIGRWV